MIPCYESQSWHVADHKSGGTHQLLRLRHCFCCGRICSINFLSIVWGGKERHQPAWLESPTCWRHGVYCFAGLSLSAWATSLIQHLLPGSATDWLLGEEKGRQMLLLRFQSFRSHWLHEIQIPQVFLNLCQDGQITTGDKPSFWAEMWNQRWRGVGLLKLLLRSE